MQVSKTFFLLKQEALLAQSCLCNGLNALRAARLGDREGLFYSAFFELSIGFERMMKLLLIVDHMAAHDLTPPPIDVIRGYGHKLLPLFKAVKEASARRGLDSLAYMDTDQISARLLAFLSDFADTDGRYANINALTSHVPTTASDPLASWGELSRAIFADRASATAKRWVQEARKVGAQIAPFSMSAMTSLKQEHLSVEELFANSALLEASAAYAIADLVQLIAALAKVLEAATQSALALNSARSPDLPEIPELGEMFYFARMDKKDAFRRRRWP